MKKIIYCTLILLYTIQNHLKRNVKPTFIFNDVITTAHDAQEKKCKKLTTTTNITESSYKLLTSNIIHI